MGIFLTLIAAPRLWVVLWGTSIMKSFDAFLLAMLMVLLAATARMRGRTCPAGAVKPFRSSRLRLAVRASDVSAGRRSTLLHA